MSADDETLRVYGAKVADYVAMTGVDKPGGALRRFIETLPQGATVLDFGCGPGTDAAFMQAAGLTVDAIDATPEMVEAARAKGVSARVATFDDLDAVATYDGIWASFSLLHAPRAALPRHIAAIRRALNSNGVVHVGMKLGEAEARDPLGRFYTYVTRDEIVGLLQAVGLDMIDLRETRDKGLAGTVEPGILILARVGHDDA
jgi:SAM-dependent methyltransferase